jgi:mannose-6-phosphate isomerase-like protein (cupin superfamily)
MLVGPDLSGSGLTASWVEILGGSEPGPYHKHDGAATFYLVIEGRVRFVVGGEVIDADPGEGCYMDVGVPHATHNMGDETAHVLLIFDHPTDGDFVEVPLTVGNAYSLPWKARDDG